MTELEWLKFLRMICEGNARENEKIVNLKVPTLDGVQLSLGGRYRVHGKEIAYEHIKGYIEDRIKELEENE